MRPMARATSVLLSLVLCCRAQRTRWAGLLTRFPVGIPFIGLSAFPYKNREHRAGRYVKPYFYDELIRGLLVQWMRPVGQRRHAFLPVCLAFGDANGVFLPVGPAHLDLAGLHHVLDQTRPP